MQLHLAKNSFLILIFWGVTLTLHAQSFYKELTPRTSVLSIGVGPSFIYADNGAQYHQKNFEINPAASIAYILRFHNHWGLQTTTGLQIIESGGTPGLAPIRRWQETGGAFRFNGLAYFADVMPTFYLMPYFNHMNRPLVNIYVGTGIGIIHVDRKEYFSFDPSEQPSKASITSGYIPVRGGIDLKLSSFSDLSLEGTILFSFSDYLDGNAGYNSFYDHLFQMQIKYKYLFNRK
ncbi:hypothetical protein [Mongoliitalea daihaiensis]|uniref:hypothetical protein n=1 Tax=Mongoliitalea daihaiensis TaxID=2782006 RepID=UPI001F4107FF|nr:hypothetical protein [Mongoliitalea daihaiensis]UJP63503.1 hypothetical protein IPZ59_11680 [Mongoliitalea daihaiensis]